MPSSHRLNAILSQLNSTRERSNSVAPAPSHCQVPCGIFDDQGRVKMLREDAETIRKAMVEMKKLEGKTDTNSVNQMIRWVMYKEQHASNIQKTISDYFMAQKIKPVMDYLPGYQDYTKILAEHHMCMVAAMKCKQTASDFTWVDQLDHTIDHLAAMYNK